MDALSDDLFRPLGASRPSRSRRRKPPAKAGPVLTGLLALVLGGIAGFLAFAEDPMGGEPHVLVPIETPAAASTATRDGAPEPDRTRQTRASAADVESASGVAVVRPNDTAAPSDAVIIRVPETDGSALDPAPDPRLVERTRAGLLPKRGPDGSRPLEVYARPVEPGTGASKPRIAIVVTGLGIGQVATSDAIAKLPGPVTLAFAPYGADLHRHAGRAREAGHEIMLQVPMEPFDYPDNDPGPHTLLTDAKPADAIERLHWIMSRFAGYIGLVNFMGGKLMANEGAIGPVLREIGGRGLAFLDDGSSPRSVAAAVGPRVGAATARADRVIDASPKGEAIERELAALEALARQRGLAVGTASALPSTVERIARWSRTLESKGIRLVPVSTAFSAEPAR